MNKIKFKSFTYILHFKQNLTFYCFYEPKQLLRIKTIIHLHIQTKDSLNMYKTELSNDYNNCIISNKILKFIIKFFASKYLQGNNSN